MGNRIAVGPAGDQRIQGHAAPVIGRHNNFVGPHAVGQFQQIAGAHDDMAAGIVRQPLVHGAEAVLMHEGEVILQMPALAAQHLQQVPGAPSRADHQEARTQQRMAPQQQEQRAGDARACGETGGGSDAQGNRYIPAQDRRCKSSRGDGKRNHQRDAPQRLVHFHGAFAPVQAQGVHETQVQCREQDDLGIGLAIQCQVHRHGPGERDQQRVHDKQGKTGSHEWPFRRQANGS